METPKPPERKNAIQVHIITNAYTHNLIINIDIVNLTVFLFSTGREVCEEPIGEGFFEILGLGTKRHEIHPCHDNPSPCQMPYDWDRCRSLGYNCGVQRPELSSDDLEPIDRVCEKPCPGNPDMFEAKELAVCQPERYLAPGT